MNVCVFLGPTLDAADAARILDVTYRPPVRLGDVYRVVSQQRPNAIGIVDGYFQWVPAVWHKEILWAIAEGVHVFGAASMGALRAAELAPFGMRGVGRIFEAYRDGRFEGMTDAFEDDDEVAVVHGPAGNSYVGGSEAMVNIRCTLARAVSEGVIGESTHHALVADAKAAFFPDRGYASLLANGRATGLPEPELAALESWLPSGRVDQKRLDAVAMLGTMRDFLAAGPPPAVAEGVFERTTFWEDAEAAFRVAAEPSAARLLLAALRIDVAECEPLGEDELRDWYFTTIAGTPVPTDLDEWLREVGYTDSGDFHRDAFVEYLRHAPEQGGRP